MTRTLAAAYLLMALSSPAPAQAPERNLEVMQHNLPDGLGLEVVTLTPTENRFSYEVFVIPGSSCRGLAPIAMDYFRGLAHARVTILHKRHVNAKQWPGPQPCKADFVHDDSLSQWFADASAYIDQRYAAIKLPLLLVGISEGAELAPQLALRRPWISGLALIGSTGLDPADALSRLLKQTRRSGELSQLQSFLSDPGTGTFDLWGGRTARYWRDMLNWKVTNPLLSLEQTVWIGFGTQDALQPIDGLCALAQQAQGSRPRINIRLFDAADHGLWRNGDAPLQSFWASLDSIFNKVQMPADAQTSESDMAAICQKFQG